MMLRLLESLAAFLLGFILYPLLELLWRGNTHISMAFAGGVCLLFIFLINIQEKKVPFLIRCLLCAAVITGVEFLFGMVCNRWLGWGVWDYSALPFSLFGQICLPYSLLWFLLSVPLCLFIPFFHRLFLKFFA